MISPLLTIRETSEYLKLSESMTYCLVRNKDFPSIKVGGSWRVFKDKLQPYLESLMEDKE